MTDKPDLSDSDIKFALNIGIKFRKPEEVFGIEIKEYENNDPNFEPDKAI